MYDSTLRFIITDNLSVIIITLVNYIYHIGQYLATDLLEFFQ